MPLKSQGNTPISDLHSVPTKHSPGQAPCAFAICTNTRNAPHYRHSTPRHTPAQHSRAHTAQHRHSTAHAPTPHTGTAQATQHNTGCAQHRQRNATHTQHSEHTAQPTQHSQHSTAHPCFVCVCGLCVRVLSYSDSKYVCVVFVLSFLCVCCFW